MKAFDNALIELFIVCVNVLFLSNSQRNERKSLEDYSCLSYVSMFSF